MNLHQDPSSTNRDQEGQADFKDYPSKNQAQIDGDGGKIHASNTEISETGSTKKINVQVAASDLHLSPENFSMVVSGVYRSSFPRPENFAFLKKLNLKSILYVS